ncbi:MAG: trigger factor, partial [Eubacteriales bacterium]|nr:trigger factor [Eubacteriales bacterium]
MKRNLIAAIAGSLILCVAAAGCGSQAEPQNTTEASSAATTEAAAEAATEAVAEEEDNSWQEEDDAYLTGVKAEDYVELPEKYDRLKVEAAKPVDPTDEDVENRIQQELDNRTTLEESTHTHVREGYVVSIDYVGKIDGEAFEGGTGSYDLEIGSGTFIEGFEEGLIGAKKGETLDINVTFPENYSATDLAGKDAVFTVTINKISEYITPKLTDEYVKSLNLTNAFGQAVTNVEEYRDYIRSNLIEEREATYEDTVKSAVAEKIVQESTLKQDPPENLVKRYNYLLTRQLEYYALQSYMDLPTLMGLYFGATEDNYKEMIYDMAGSYAKQGLVLQAVADAENLNPDADEVSTAIAEYVAMDATTESVDDLDRLIKESLRDELLTDNVIEWLYKHCKVEEPAEEPAEGATAAEAAEAGNEENADDSSTGNTAAAAETEEDKDSEKDEKS